MPVKMKITAKPGNTKAVAAFNDLPDIGFKLFKKLASERLSRVINILKALPGPVVYPILWTTIRQQVAFFASNGFGRGIPTGRTGDTASGWRKRIVDKGGGVFVASITNNKPAAKFVYGALTRNVAKARIPQQRFHSATGWRLASPLVDLEFQGLRQDIKRQFSTEVKRRASQR